MAKLGENVPYVLDKAIDFMASSQAFMEYLKKSPRITHVPKEIPAEKCAMFNERLAYYRDIYRPDSDQKNQQ